MPNRRRRKKAPSAAVGAADAAPPSGDSDDAKQQQQQQQVDEAASSAAAVPAASTAVPSAEELDTQARLEMLRALHGIGNVTMDSTAQKTKYKFWETQPVPQFGAADSPAAASDGSGASSQALTSQDSSNPVPDGPIDPPKTVSDVRQKPYKLGGGGFEWCDLDLLDPAQLDELYTLLSLHYVEDDDNLFRFDYSRPFLQWALMPPGFRSDWHVGIRAKASGELMACITAIPAEMSVNGTPIPMVEINYLCVHKGLRAKRLAPVLIREITRRVNLTGRWQAVYTAGVVLPRPLSQNRYFHRSLNPKKLIEVRFSALRRNMTLARTIKLYRLPTQPAVPGFRAMRAADLQAAHKLLTEYLTRFPLHPEFSLDEFRHFFLPRDGVIHSFVVEDPATKTITAFSSFYSLPSTIINHAKHSLLRAAYSYYHVPGPHPLKDILQDCMIAANALDFDVFNALDVMENSQDLLKDLKFGIGDGQLQYYVFNWRCAQMKASDVALVLV